MKRILGHTHTLTWFLRHFCETFLISTSQVTELGLAAKALPLRLFRKGHLALRTVISKPQGFSHESQTVRRTSETAVLDSRSNPGHWALLLTGHEVLCVMPTLPSSWACKSPRGAVTPWECAFLGAVFWPWEARLLKHQARHNAASPPTQNSEQDLPRRTCPKRVKLFHKQRQLVPLKTDAQLGWLLLLPFQTCWKGGDTAHEGLSLSREVLPDSHLAQRPILWHLSTKTCYKSGSGCGS